MIPTWAFVSAVAVCVAVIAFCVGALFKAAAGIRIP